GPATAARLHEPAGIALDGDGNLFISDVVNATVRRVSPTASRLAVLTPPPGAAPAGSPFTVSVAVQDPGGNTVAGYDGAVSVALGDGSPARAALAGHTTVPAVNGVA